MTASGSLKLAGVGEDGGGGATVVVRLMNSFGMLLDALLVVCEVYVTASEIAEAPRPQWQRLETR